MRYFTRIADRSFRTDPQGKELFFLYGVFSHPHIIPTPDEKRRLHRKLTWFYRVYLGGFMLILIVVVFGGLFEEAFSKPVVFLSVVIGVSTLQCSLMRLIFRHDLRVLKRMESRPRLRDFYVGLAAQQSWARCVFAFIFSLLASVGALFMLWEEPSPWIPMFICLFFGLLASASGYTIALKMKPKKAETVSGANAG